MAGKGLTQVAKFVENGRLCFFCWFVCFFLHLHIVLYLQYYCKGLTKVSEKADDVFIRN